MNARALLLVGVIVAGGAAIPGAQQAEYPLTLIAPAKGPFTFPAGYQTPWDRIEIRVTEQMSPNLFVLHGSQGLDAAHPDASGGRALVLFGPDGVLMVDTQNRQVAGKTLKAIRSFTAAPIKVLVNTHVHSDHTGANAFFARQGALIFSQENLRDEMLRPPPRAGRPAPAPDAAGIPVSTYRYNAATPGEPAVTLHMNGETVDFIPMMPSHTAGDTIVRFRNANVIYIEDFYRNFGYPFADQANGGSIRGMLDAVDLIERLAGPDTTLVPGHGTLVKKADLLPYRAMLVDVMARVQALRDQGRSLNDVLAANLTAPYDRTTLGDTQQSKDRFITEVYDEAGGLPAIVDGTRAMRPALVRNDFTESAEGWSISGDTNGAEPIFSARGGDPGGCIIGSDEALGETWYFHAPAAVLQQLPSAVNGTLSYSLKQSGPMLSLIDDDVVIMGAAGRLSYRFRTSPGTDWTDFSVRLSESEGWTWNWNKHATQAQIESVLAAPRRLEIRGEYVTGPDQGSLDNFVLTAALK